MSEKKEQFGFLKNLKKYKHLDVVIVIIFIIIILLILMSDFDFNFIANNSEKTNSNIYYISSIDYIEKLEDKTEQLLEKLDGVQNINVMISLKEAPKYNYEQINNEQSIISEIIDVSNSNISLISDILPEIQGIVVVGKFEISSQLKIISVLETLYNIDTKYIQVFSI